MSGAQQRNTEKSWWQRFWDGFLNGFRSLCLIIMGLVFAPISTVLALIMMAVRGRQDLSGKAFNEFIADNPYRVIGVLILEVGVLHWLFPVTNIVASSLLGFLGGPVVWIVFGACLGALIFASVTDYFIARSMGRKLVEAGPIERYGLPLATFIFSPISTVLGFLVACKKNISLSELIERYPLIAFGFVALEVGLLHWLVPQTNFLLNLVLGAVSTAVISPVLWCLVGLALLLIIYSVYRDCSRSPCHSAIPSPPISKDQHPDSRAILPEAAPMTSQEKSRCLKGGIPSCESRGSFFSRLWS